MEMGGYINLEAIVLAGGLGTRLASVVSEVPKPMALVAGKPFLAYLLDNLKAQGVTHVILAVCHLKEHIMEYFGNEYRGMALDYSVEDTPLGTGGAIRKALELCREERAFVCNGDSFFDVDLHTLRAYATTHEFQIVIVLKPLTNFSRYGTVETGDQGMVLSFREKQPCAQGKINGGIYDIKRDALMDYPVRFSMEQDCFPQLLKNGQVGSVDSEGYFIDIGIPEDYARVQKESERLKG